MSVNNGKVCCNCRHNIRINKENDITCYCDIDNLILNYYDVMTGWCRHWSKERKKENDNTTEQL